MNKSICRTITEEEAGQTVGQWLKRTLKLTSAQIRSLKFREKGICRNGQRVRVTELLKAGDVLELCLEADQEQRSDVLPQSHPLEVLYEDEDVIALWKEAGVILHPARGHSRDCLANYLRAYLEEKGEQAPVRSIGRLDGDTSGIVVFAKNKVAAERLWRQRERGDFFKEYLAVCEKEFPREMVGKEITISRPLKEEPDLHKMCVAADGRPAVTHCRVLDGSRILLRLETGRTHQIRAHMAWLGYPLRGDSLYGSGKRGETYAQLCAFRTEFLQPFTGQKICLEKWPRNGERKEKL